MNMAPARVVRFRLSEILQELGWTQRQLAERTGLSENTISSLVNNPMAIRMDTLDAICLATGKQPQDLFDYEEGNL